MISADIRSTLTERGAHLSLDLPPDLFTPKKRMGFVVFMCFSFGRNEESCCCIQIGFIHSEFFAVCRSALVVSDDRSFTRLRASESSAPCTPYGNKYTHTTKNTNKQRKQNYWEATTNVLCRVIRNVLSKIYKWCMNWWHLRQNETKNRQIREYMHATLFHCECVCLRNSFGCSLASSNSLLFTGCTATESHASRVRPPWRQKIMLLTTYKCNTFITQHIQRYIGNATTTNINSRRTAGHI